MSKIYHLFHSDSLYRNSIYLMASTFIMAFLGFFFWMLNARLFTSSEIGLATTLISVTNLLLGLSNFGLNQGIVRYLPSSENKNTLVTSIILVISIITCLFSIIFIFYLGYFTPSLKIVLNTFFVSLLFVLFTVFSAINAVTDSIIIALRKTQYILAKNTIFAVLKLVLPFLFVSLGAFGIYTAVSSAVLLVTVMALVVIYIKFKIHYGLVIDKNEILKITIFSMSNYISGFVGSLPSYITPILIANYINDKTVAYYYFDMMIVSILVIISTSTSQSLLAEGSNKAINYKDYFWKSLKLISVILIPAVISVLLFGQYILLAFGKEYSQEGLSFLKLMTLSSLITPFNHIFNTILNIKKRADIVIFMSVVNTSITLLLSYLLVQKGLVGLGVAWLISEILVVFIYALIIKIKLK